MHLKTLAGPIKKVYWWIYGKWKQGKKGIMKQSPVWEREEDKDKGGGVDLHINSPQSFSSSPSEHSGKPLHLRCSLMQDWSPHMNMPSEHLVRHISGFSSSPPWQSASPSHSQSRRMHGKPPTQAYSSERQEATGQSWNFLILLKSLADKYVTKVNSLISMPFKM